MRTEARVFIYSIFLGLCIWVVDALFSWRFTPHDSFIGAALTEAPAHKLYLRSLIVLSLSVFGWIMATALAKRTAAEGELREMGARLELILDSAHDGIFGLDLDGRFTFVNDATAALLGYRVAEMMGEEAHSLIHHSHKNGTPYDRDECPILQASEDRVTVTSEVLWRSDGESINVHYTVAPICEDGERQGTVVAFRRVTTDELAVEELERLRRLSQLILTWAGEGIFGLDADGRITFANPAAAVMLGYEVHELVGKRAHPLLQHHREDGSPHPENQSLIYASSEDDDVYHVSDEVFWRKDNNSLPVEYTATPLRDAGRVTGAVVVFQDITERKLAERDLRDTLAELARSNAELEQFAYVISHDLQEPLRMVQSYVELLGRRYAERLDKDAGDFIRFAVDGAVRMQQMIEDLLRYSRVGSRGGEMQQVEMDEALAEALANLSVSIEATGAQITSGGLPAVVADRPQMVQLLQNLVGNAIKFHGAEAPRVSITAEQETGAWLFSVTDNGIGIAPEQRERIFAIFQRLHGADSYPGTGIGLAICKKIVESHGGSIWVEPQSGPGTTFRFRLPMQIASGLR